MPFAHFPIPQPKNKKIDKTPFKVLDAPNLEDDYYLNLLEWSDYCNNIAIGLGDRVYLWDAARQDVRKLAESNNNSMSNTIVSSVSWAKNEPFLAVGSSNGSIEIYDIIKSAKIR